MVHTLTIVEPICPMLQNMSKTLRTGYNYVLNHLFITQIRLTTLRLLSSFPQLTLLPDAEENTNEVNNEQSCD